MMKTALSRMEFWYVEMCLSASVGKFFQIDFQLCCYGSPVLDLGYFFYLSSSDEIKFNQEKFHELVKLYHEQLSCTMRHLKCQTKPPTLFQLQQEYSRRHFATVLYVLLIYPILVNENEKDADMTMLVGDTEKCKAFRRGLIENPKAVQTMKHYLPLWDAYGLLDPLK